MDAINDGDFGWDFSGLITTKIFEIMRAEFCATVLSRLQQERDGKVQVVWHCALPLAGNEEKQ